MGNYKQKAINYNKLKVYISKVYVPKDNRLKPLSKSGVKLATRRDMFAVTELDYNGNIQYNNKTFIEFNDYEITEYKRIIKK